MPKLKTTVLNQNLEKLFHNGHFRASESTARAAGELGRKESLAEGEQGRTGERLVGEAFKGGNRRLGASAVGGLADSTRRE